MKVLAILIVAASILSYNQALGALEKNPTALNYNDYLTVIQQLQSYSVDVTPTAGQSATLTPSN
jgi:hypothetical protein